MSHSRLKTYTTVLFIVGIIMFMLLGGASAIYTFAASTRNVSLFHGLLGIFGSPAAGLSHFREFVGSAIFFQLLGNSLVLSVMPSIIAVIFAIPAAGAVGGMEAGRKRSAATVALLMPAFIPDFVLAFIVQQVFPSQAITDPTLFRVIMVLLAAIRPACICAFVGACTAGLCKDNGKSVLHGAAAGVLVGIAVSLVRFLSSNIELLTLLHNPFVFSTTDTFDSFGYRQGFILFQFSYASAIWVFKTLLQMFAAVLVAVVVFYCVGMGLEDKYTYPYSSSDKQAGLVPGLIGALALVAGLLIPVMYSGSAVGNMLMRAIGHSVITTTASAVLFSIMLFALAAWLCVNINKMGALILVLVLVAIVNNTVGGFMLFHRLGLTNTHHAVILYNAFNIAFVLPLAYLARLRNVQFTTFASIVQAMLPYLVVFVGLFVANTWGNSFPQMIYLHDRMLWGVPMLLVETVSFANGMPVAGMILGVTMPILAIAVVTGCVYVVTDRVDFSGNSE
ncbi:MAG: hypothetical protein FWC92_05085 [Defluviitaleaceae bacterium]|nr:hypothetical protein [Defluviitaleaceae bacterium]